MAARARLETASPPAVERSVRIRSPGQVLQMEAMALIALGSCVKLIEGGQGG